MLSALAEMSDYVLSPEAEAAAATFRGTTSVPNAVRRSGSGLELSLSGFDADVEMAVQLNASTTVPVLADGAFVAC